MLTTLPTTVSKAMEARRAKLPPWHALWLSGGGGYSRRQRRTIDAAVARRLRALRRSMRHLEMPLVRISSSTAQYTYRLEQVKHRRGEHPSFQVSIQLNGEPMATLEVVIELHHGCGTADPTPAHLDLDRILRSKTFKVSFHMDKDPLQVIDWGYFGALDGMTSQTLDRWMNAKVDLWNAAPAVPPLVLLRQRR